MTCITGRLFYHFWAPLGTPGGPKGSKHSKNQWFFNIFKIGPRPSKVTSGRPKTPPRAPFFSARGRGRALGPPKISERPPWNPIWGPGGSKRPPWSIKTPTFSGQGFQKEILLPVAATDTFFRKCLSGPRGKQYSFFENLTPLGRGPPNGPSRHQKTSKNDPLGIEIIQKTTPKAP